MNRVLIIGGGFGGLAAAKRLSSSGLDIYGVLIDQKQTSDFLPTLPDCLGRGIRPEHLSYPLESICKKIGFKFVNGKVTSADLQKREVSVGNIRFNYDYLIVASGSETNFYGNENIQRSAFKLDDAKDAGQIVGKLNGSSYGTYVIVGGGYTGIEVATNMRIFLNKAKRAGKIIIVERAPSILGPLPDWMKQYVSANLEQLDIDVLVNTQIEKIEEIKVYISGGKVFDNAFVVWAAGVKTAGFIQNLKVKKNPQGRIEVDRYLRMDEGSFAAGDAAYFRHKDIYLRMAVQFAITQGRLAAENAANSIRGKKLLEYKPVDLGYIIPMANNRSCGEVLGVRMKGMMPTMFHFMMCAFRSWSWKNRLGIIKGLIKGGI